MIRCEVSPNPDQISVVAPNDCWMFELYFTTVVCMNKQRRTRTAHHLLDKERQFTEEACKRLHCLLTSSVVLCLRKQIPFSQYHLCVWVFISRAGGVDTTHMTVYPLNLFYLLLFIVVSCLTIIFSHYTSDCLWEIFITSMFWLFFTSLLCTLHYLFVFVHPNTHTLMCEKPATRQRKVEGDIYYRFLFHHNFRPHVHTSRELLELS